MKTRLFLVLSLMVLVPSAFANRVLSRSIMDSCQFVYRTDSDIRVYPSEELFQIFAGAPLYARISFKNSWKKGPAKSENYVIAVSDDKYASLTLETMSTSGDYLFRDMTFEWGVKNEDGTFFDLSREYYVDIGRDFGQNCRTVRGPDSEFVERIVQ